MPGVVIAVLNGSRARGIWRIRIA